MDNSSLYRKNRHACYLLQYHLVVVTKYRHPVIVEPLRSRLVQISEEVFSGWKCPILEINTEADHIHILFEAPPQVQLSKLINNYKTVSSRLIRKEFNPFLSDYYWKPYFWSESYFICTVSEKSAVIIQYYIRNQAANPAQT